MAIEPHVLQDIPRACIIKERTLVLELSVPDQGASDLERFWQLIISLFQNPTNPTFVAVREQLRLEVERRGLSARDVRSIAVAFSVSISAASIKEPQDVLAHFATFANSIQAHQGARNAPNAYEDKLCVRQVEVNPKRLVVTSHVVRAVQALMTRFAGLVVCNDVELPLIVACSTEDLTVYLSAFSAGLRVDIDAGDDDEPERVGVILEAVSRCASVHTVAIGPILQSLNRLDSRDFFWSKLLETVLSGDATALPRLLFECDDDLLQARDVALIRRAREKVRHRVRRVDALWFTVEQVDPFELIEVIRLAEGMTELQLETDLLTSSVVSRVLEACLTVRKLMLCGIDVQSMAVFIDFCERRAASGTFLESLHIQDIRIAEESSIATFFCALTDPATAVGTQDEPVEPQRFLRT